MPRRLGACLAAASLVVGGCLGNDYARSPIDVGDQDLGARVVVEPGDRFTVGLLAHPAHSQAAWVIAEVDRNVVSVDRSVHEPLGTEVPDEDLLAQMPEAVQEIWSTVPTPDRPPEVEDPERGSMWLYPLTHFEFSGAGLGETTLAMVLRVDGEAVHEFSVEVSVVDDACAFFEGQESMTKVPHRCG
jgi:hypothetical protein